MNKLMLSAVAAAALCAGGAALAQDGGADCQAGSAWGTPPGCGAGPTPNYGNSGWPPPGAVVVPQQAPYGYYGNRAYPPQYSAVPAYPYYRQQQLNRTRRDRDGDGVPNRSDRYPDDPSRW